MIDGLDRDEQLVISTAGRLATLYERLARWKPSSPEDTRWLKHFDMYESSGCSVNSTYRDSTA